MRSRTRDTHGHLGVEHAEAQGLQGGLAQLHAFTVNVNLGHTQGSDTEMPQMPEVLFNAASPEELYPNEESASQLQGGSGGRRLRSADCKHKTLLEPPV